MPVDVTADKIHIRVKDPALFVQDSYKTIVLSADQGIEAVIGKLQSDSQGPTVIQKYIFDKTKWSVTEAEKWVNDHTKRESSTRMSSVESVLRMSYENGKPPVLEGYAVRYGLLSDNPMMGDPQYVKEKILPGAFRNSIERNDIRMYVDHSHTTEKLLGRKGAGTLQLSEDVNGVMFRCTPPDTMAGKDIVLSVKRGDVSHMSFGYNPIPSKERWTKEGNYRVRNVEEGDLFEISAVDIPVWEGTSLAVRCSDPNMIVVGDFVFDITPVEKAVERKKAEEEGFKTLESQYEALRKRDYIFLKT
jgi:HK97 family phage prohead protease